MNGLTNLNNGNEQAQCRNSSFIIAFFSILQTFLALLLTYSWCKSCCRKNEKNFFFK